MSKKDDDLSDEGQMFFEDALSTIRGGTSARRLSWPEGKSICFENGQVVAKSADSTDATEWTPSAEDLIANDWEVV